MLCCPQQQRNEAIKVEASPAAETSRIYIERLNFFPKTKSFLQLQKLDARGYFQERSNTNLTASFEEALQIVKPTKLHTTRESRIKPCAVNTLKLILSETSAKKIQQVSLFNEKKGAFHLCQKMSKSKLQLKSSLLCSLFNWTNQQISRHVCSYWYLFDTYIWMISKRSFCIVMCWKLQPHLKK